LLTPATLMRLTRRSAVEVFRIGALHFVHLAVAQCQVQIGAAGGISHATGVGQDDTAPLGVPQVVNRHIIQCIRGGSIAGGAQEELAGHDSLITCSFN